MTNWSARPNYAVSETRYLKTQRSLTKIVRKNQNGSSELIHYGVLGMKWGIRKDQIKESVKKTAIKARDFTYRQLDVKDFDDLIDKLKTTIKDPKGVALLAGVILLPDPLVFGGIAAYNALKANGKLSAIIHEDSSTNDLYHYK